MQMGKKRKSGATDKQILAAYDLHRSAAVVGKELGVAASTVYRVLLKNSVECTGLEEYRKRITKFQGQEKAIRKMYESGATHDQLREKFGPCSDYALKHAITRAGGSLRENPVPQIKDGELATIKNLHAAGLSQAKIAVQMHRSYSWVNRLLREAGVQSPNRSGKEHGRWEGGRMKAQGYWRVKVEADDPLACMRNNAGYVLEHRLVMARKMGRPLTRKETVHHIDGDGLNNADDNLQLRQGRHGKHVAFRCCDCGSTNVQPYPLED